MSILVNFSDLNLVNFPYTMIKYSEKKKQLKGERIYSGSQFKGKSLCGSQGGEVKVSRSRWGGQRGEVTVGKSRWGGQGEGVKWRSHVGRSRWGGQGGKVMVGRSRWQEAEATDHIDSRIMEQRGMNSCCSSPFHSLCSPGIQPGNITTHRGGASHFTNTIKITSHREV